MKSLSSLAFIAILAGANLQAAGTLTVVSAATFLGGSLAPKSIATAFGSDLAADSAQVVVTGSAGVARSAMLFYSSPVQVNFQIPPGTVIGPATVTVTSSDGTVSQTTVNIATVSPGLFQVGMQLIVTASDGARRRPPWLYQCVPYGCVISPINLGPAGSQTALELFGTGIRGRSSLANVICTIGGVTPTQVLYAGPAPGFIGLDQLNIVLPSYLSGASVVPIAITVDSQPANTAKLM